MSDNAYGSFILQLINCACIQLPWITLQMPAVARKHNICCYAILQHVGNIAIEIITSNVSAPSDIMIQ